MQFSNPNTLPIRIHLIGESARARARSQYHDQRRRFLSRHDQVPNTPLSYPAGRSEVDGIAWIMSFDLVTIVESQAAVLVEGMSD